MVLGQDAAGCPVTNPRHVQPLRQSILLHPPEQVFGPCLRLGPALLTLSHVRTVETSTSPAGAVLLSIQLLPAEVPRFDSVVRHAGGSHLAFVILGQVLSTPTASPELTQPAPVSGTIQIAGGMSPSDPRPVQIAEALHAELRHQPTISSYGASASIRPPSPASVQPLLNSVSCIPRGDCVVVGDGVTLVRPDPTAQWSEAAVGRSPDLGSISCIAAGTCLAIGSSGTTGNFERWDGESWTTLPVPPGPTAGSPFFVPPTDLSCVDTSFCVGVGGYTFVAGNISGPLQVAVIERWTRGAWSAPLLLNPELPTDHSAVFDVSCVSASFCMAVGDRLQLHEQALSRAWDQTFAEAWDGARWSSVPTPSEDGSAVLQSVSCTSSDFCLAVGSVEPATSGPSGVIADVWNGSSWVAGTTTPELRGVRDLSSSVSTLVCTSQARCLATWSSTWAITRFGGPTPVDAEFSAASQLWNGSSWKPVPMPNPRPASGQSNILFDESCVTSQACVAVGTTTDGINRRSLIESWDGSRWTIDPFPNL